MKPYEAWNVAQSNPCFEIWLYYHHYDCRPDVDEIRRHPSIKTFVNKCVAGGFDFQKDPVRLKDAIDNSDKNVSRDADGCPVLFSTEQHLLGKQILMFVDGVLQKLRNKTG